MTSSTLQCNLAQCRRKWHVLLSDYDRFKGTAAVGAKLSSNFDYELIEAVKRIVRAREERGMVDPESDTEAGNDVLDAPVEIWSKRKGQRSKFRHHIQKPKLEQRQEDSHEEEREDKPFFPWVKREEVKHVVVRVEENNTNNNSNSEGVAEQALSDVETVKVKVGNVATENQGEQRRLAVFDTPAEGRELLEALIDIEDHFIRAYDSRKEVTRTLEVKRIKKEWKTLEEDLPPPKPPDLKLQVVASGFPSYDNTMMKRSQEIKFHGSNLEDKIVLQRGVMIGYK
ncbi:hypothetical protein LR48_Vigan08g014100 [Vigna angularis]|uniref:Myb-like domain-containing protein n=1 Tax=Phaseolus angularis TaxID=3914 RepID=A0A0L9V3J6_PHAAN|nr:hypothetical protein LR48_Vigan08g014100 [Vigna angularis]